MMSSKAPATKVDTNNDDPVVTAEDVLRHQEELEQEAAEVLSRSIDECSCLKGAVRQPVYSCLTCSRSNGSDAPIGVCYACFVQCHTDHEVVELSARWSFQCDCGTTLMKGELLMISFRRERNSKDGLH
ncbi:hypothetical protein HK405_008742 [Cladochytrium tenue]|nr:hypothetical protein HK405_008742 [Cladochytrium tenue]